MNLYPLDQPLKPDKGIHGGSCNRRACQAPGAMWFNKSTRAYYCESCARAINYYCPDGEEPLCIYEGEKPKEN